MAAKLIKYIGTHLLIHIISVLKNVYDEIKKLQKHYFCAIIGQLEKIFVPLHPEMWTCKTLLPYARVRLERQFKKVTWMGVGI